MRYPAPTVKEEIPIGNLPFANLIILNIGNFWLIVK